MMWTGYFLKAQVAEVVDAVFYQDNKSSMLLKNGVHPVESILGTLTFVSILWQIEWLRDTCVLSIVQLRI